MCNPCLTPLISGATAYGYLRYTLQGRHRLLHLALLALVFPPHKWSNEPMVPFYFFFKKNKNMLKQFKYEHLGSKVPHQDDSDPKYKN